ncbi:ATP-binding cassette domain-containing protein [Dehalococcoidia bacterium]|nr:ATP-binding cassette domain-containing protein [Dehalococcoidia bacterium]MCL0050749.1 ATP-binding cassette domain-containing protein [Dehalococcoidia bacterium]
METLLSIRNISKQFGKNTVVDQVSFDVHKGEILGVLGPNGAGKTTVIRSIMDIIRPDSGEIRFNFQDNNNFLSQIGYLPEERGLYRDSRVTDILLYLAQLKEYPRDRARKRVLEYLAKFDLENAGKMKIKELSRGMAQKVQFIGAILHEPAILILDEAFSGLDPVSQDVFSEEIRNLARNGVAVLFSSHQMNLVENLCDRIFMIHKGKKVLYDTLLRIKQDFGSFKCEIMSEENIRDKFINFKETEKIEQEGLRTTIYLKKGVEPGQFIQKLPDNISIEEVTIKRDSLHDIFVRTVTEN